MKALRFWIEIAKGLLGVWDNTTKEMGYTPFTAKKTVTKVKSNGDSNQFGTNKRGVENDCV